MGIYIDLRADPDVMKSAESDVLGDFSDVELRALKLDASKDKLLQDLTSEMRLNKSDTTDLATIDTVISADESRWQTVLMYVQLWYYFREVFAEEGDQNYIRMQDYKSAYASERSGFAYLTTETHSTSKLIQVTRG